MTPHECFNTQGFPKGFKLAENQCDSRLYKQAGNSVCVSVISRIAECVAQALKETYPKVDYVVAINGQDTIIEMQ